MLRWTERVAANSLGSKTVTIRVCCIAHHLEEIVSKKFDV
jgi:hypothetical protein